MTAALLPVGVCRSANARLARMGGGLSIRALVACLALTCACSPDGPSSGPSDADPWVGVDGGWNVEPEDADAGPWSTEAAPPMEGLPNAPGPGAEGYTKQGSIVVPTTRPRVFWNAERIAQGKKWLESKENADALREATSKSDAHPFDLGTHYVLTGEKASCTKAVSRTTAYTIDAQQLDSTPCDTCRWEPWPYVIFDWCYDVMTESQRNTLLSRFNGYIERVIKNSSRELASGNLGAPANNYFWGYLRNEVDWAIASSHVSTKAQTFLDYGIGRRYEDSFVPFAVDGGGRGGVPLEGSHYGPYMHEYSLVPFVSAKNLGRNIFRETPYYREAIAFWIHATLPLATATRTGKNSFYQFFTFGDHSENDGYAPIANADIGNFMTVLADEFRDDPIGQYARRWVSTYKPPRTNMVLAYDRGGSERDLGTLPLDYYAKGNGFAFTRNRWSPDSTVAHLTLGRTQSFGGHDHTDVGSFQLWRKGRFLSRESALYASSLDWGSAMSTWAHNGLTLRHPASWKGRPYGAAEGNPLGAPSVVRLETAPTHFFAAVDLTRAYQTTDPAYYVTENGVQCFRDHNPYVSSAVREFVFVRPLEALVVLDRVRSQASSEDAPSKQKFPSYSWSAEAVESVFNLHVGMANPTIDAAARTVEAAVGGGQILRAQTLLPKTVSIVVVDEMKGLVGTSGFTDDMRQWRVEIRSSGAREQHILTVLQATSTGDASLTSETSETDSTIVLVVTHPTKGRMRLTIQKGMASGGGSIAVAAGSDDWGADAPLRETPQTFLVGDNGPSWRQ